MKKYVLALILGFGVLMFTSSCEDSLNEIEMETTGNDTKVERPD